tara:strand:+ start:1027 stop:1350 length:324 start_codon:yes stop_codon:yes gene_type:complete
MPNFADDFKANFSLYPATNKKQERSPDAWGFVKVSADQVPALIAYLQQAPRSTWTRKDGTNVEEVSIRLAGWKMDSEKYGTFLSGQVSPERAQSSVVPPADSALLGF